MLGALEAFAAPIALRKTMILTSKQLEELEHSHNSTGALSDGEKSENKEDSSDLALEWRHQLIEEAAEAIKRAQTRKVDQGLTYDVSSLLFDRESHRFGRVQISVPGYLKIDYLTGGDREWGILDLDGFLQRFRAQKSVDDLARQLALDAEDVREELESRGIAPQDNGKPKPEKSASKSIPSRKGDNAANQTTVVEATPEREAKSKAKVSKPAAKPKTTATAKAQRTLAANTFIRENFTKFSNKDLAVETGLSEHTIRRKLGEWGLKRKK